MNKLRINHGYFLQLCVAFLMWAAFQDMASAQSTIPSAGETAQWFANGQNILQQFGFLIIGLIILFGGVMWAVMSSPRWFIGSVVAAVCVGAAKWILGIIAAVTQSNQT